ncbi:hypothetical protein D3C87_2061560 [compost metagenome]
MPRPDVSLDGDRHLLVFGVNKIGGNARNVGRFGIARVECDVRIERSCETGRERVAARRNE